MAWFRTALAALRIGRAGPLAANQSLLEFRRFWVVPVWLQVALVAGLFVMTVLLTNAEYRRHGTVFGFAGPAFNVLINPIYEELIFRGWILGRLVRYHSNTVAIIISSLLFGLLHLRNIYWMDTHTLVHTMAYTGLVLGPLLGCVTLRLRTVWPAVILHYLNNLAYYL
jgi:membrane protease YdiL (CAAX protease family)